jgi:hypothetical protein
LVQGLATILESGRTYVDIFPSGKCVQAARCIVPRALRIGITVHGGYSEQVEVIEVASEQDCYSVVMPLSRVHTAITSTTIDDALAGSQSSQMYFILSV